MPPSFKEEILQWHEACLMFDARDFKQSLQMLEAIADSSKIHFNMAIALINIQKEDSAIASLSKAVACDPYMAIAYYIRGILFFKRNLFTEALADFTDALQHMRSNLVIDYTQLGLPHKLYSFEISFNRGLCFSAKGNLDAAIADFDDADRSHPTSSGDRQFLEEKIDQAVDLGERAVDYVTVFELDYSKAIFKPKEEKVKNTKRVNYLGNSKVVAGADDRDAFAGFSGTLVKTEKKLVNKGPLEGNEIEFQPGAETLHRKKTLTDMSMQTQRKEQAAAARSATLSRMRIVESPPSSGRSSPAIQSRTSSLLMDDFDVTKLKRGVTGNGGGSGSSLSSLANSGNGNSMPRRTDTSSKLRVKCYYKDTRQIMVSPSISFKDLEARIQKKFDSPATRLRLKYKDKDGEMVMMADDEDLEIALEIANLENGGALEVWCFQ
ncbi:hypothetical protein BDR26DRAFT_855616 [Obelidium mucronatum]|nr:hypothetical protein BDR26DRAFT_855616 [Obelidium mucronatum]